MPNDFNSRQPTKTEQALYELQIAHNNLAALTQKMMGLLYAILHNTYPEKFERLVKDAMDNEVLKQVGQSLGMEEIKIIAARQAAKKEGVV